MQSGATIGVPNRFAQFSGTTGQASMGPFSHIFAILRGRTGQTSKQPASQIYAIPGNSTVIGSRGDPGPGVTKDPSKTFYFCDVLNCIFKRT